MSKIADLLSSEELKKIAEMQSLLSDYKALSDAKHSIASALIQKVKEENDEEITKPIIF